MLEESLLFLATVTEQIFVFMLIATAAIGGMFAVVEIVQSVGKPDTRLRMSRAWVHFAGWLLLSLQFALAADLVGTAISPGWEEIGQLGAIAAIRIALGYFLERDIESLRRDRAEVAKEGEE